MLLPKLHRLTVGEWFWTRLHPVTSVAIYTTMDKIRTFVTFRHGTSTPVDQDGALCGLVFSHSSRHCVSFLPAVHRSEWPRKDSKHGRLPTRKTTKDRRNPHEHIGCNIIVHRPHRPVPVGCCAGPLGLLGGLLLCFLFLFGKMACSLSIYSLLVPDACGGATDFGCHQYEERMQ